MTTIVIVREGDWIVMAADGRVTDEGDICSECDRKIFRHKNELFGVAGNADECDALLAWFRRGRKGRKPGSRHSSFMYVGTDGVPYVSTEGSRPTPFDLPRAIGSGKDLAMGAALAGVGAREAVHIAMRRDTRTGGKVRSARVRVKAGEKHGSK